MKRREIFSIPLFVIILTTVFILAGCGGGGEGGGTGVPTINLAWDAPTTNVDGSPLTDLAGYKVNVGTAPRTYNGSIDVGNVTAYPLTGLPTGQTYYIAVTAYDTSGNESTYSNEVSGSPR
jgi:hypothetical protein